FILRQAKLPPLSFRHNTILNSAGRVMLFRGRVRMEGLWVFLDARDEALLHTTTLTFLIAPPCWDRNIKKPVSLTFETAMNQIFHSKANAMHNLDHQTTSRPHLALP